MKDVQRRVDEVRRERTEVENNLIDAYIAKRITRRTLMRRGTVLGMSVPLLGFLAAACGDSDDDSGGTTTAAAEPTTSASATTSGATSSAAEPTTSASAESSAATSGAETTTGPTPQAGGTVRVGINIPSTAIDPILVQDSGGIGMLCQTGEYLCYSDPNLELQPVLAESWEPNADGTVWTFKIRQGVTFSDGTPMTAKDVAATINRLADPANKSNALSVFKGVMEAGGAAAVDDATVEFTLTAANGNFPYLISSDNYNAIILPEAYGGDFEKTFLGTGPWILEKFTPNQGASFTRNPAYWGTKTVADRAEFLFLPDDQGMVTALQGDQVDLILNFSINGPGRALVDNPQFTLIEIPSVAHRETHMRVDQDPFKDKRVRQAMGMLVDRDALIQSLFQGKAVAGNDSPLAPAFPSTDPNVPQRTRDVEAAKSLLAEAGVPDGFKVKWNVLRTAEVPDMAAIMKENFREAGIDTELVVQASEEFYGDGQFGSSPWLDATMGTVDYGHRGVPNVFLQAQLTSEGAWNAAHFKNPTYDGLVTEYTAALDVDAQQAAAGKIQELLLDETPTIIPYFYSYLGANKNNLAGGRVTAMSHVFVDQAGFTS
jgi:peptide/nickel transport system substrate-binding protein